MDSLEHDLPEHCVGFILAQRITMIWLKLPIRFTSVPRRIGTVLASGVHLSRTDTHRLRTSREGATTASALCLPIASGARNMLFEGLDPGQKAVPGGILALIKQA
nr:hypothetical protein CFP56_04231 [Quercus suber]